MGEGVFPDGVQEPPGARRIVEDLAFATIVIGPVLMTDFSGAGFVADMVVTAGGK